MVKVHVVYACCCLLLLTYTCFLSFAVTSKMFVVIAWPYIYICFSSVSKAFSFAIYVVSTNVLYISCYNVFLDGLLDILFLLQRCYNTCIRESAKDIYEL